MSKMKEKMPPSKKVNMKGGKQVSGKNYSEVMEEFEAKKGRMSDDQWEKSKSADISGALRKSKEGYSKNPRVKPDKKKSR